MPRDDSGDEGRRMIAAYRDGLGVAAVVAAQSTDGTRIMSLPPGGSDAPAADRMLVRLWCRREAEAATVAAMAVKALRRAPDGDAGAAIRAAAKRLGVIMQTDDELAADAMAVAARIALEIRKQQQSGELKSVNRAYRSYRLAARARGEPALRYDAWMQHYREDLVRQIAATLRQI